MYGSTKEQSSTTTVSSSNIKLCTSRLIADSWGFVVPVVSELAAIEEKHTRCSFALRKLFTDLFHLRLGHSDRHRVVRPVSFFVCSSYRNTKLRHCLPDRVDHSLNERNGSNRSLDNRCWLTVVRIVILIRLVGLLISSRRRCCCCCSRGSILARLFRRSTIQTTRTIPTSTPSTTTCTSSAASAFRRRRSGIVAARFDGCWTTVTVLSVGIRHGSWLVFAVRCLVV